MAPQARSEATRRTILDAAVELFDRRGYTVVGLGDIIERAGLTKGALYYHFPSKEALAEAIITEAATGLVAAATRVYDSPAPALESLIHSSFVAAEPLTFDPTTRVGSQLMRALGEFNDIAMHSYENIREVITAEVRRVAAEGDLRDDVDPAAVGEVLVSLYLGIELLSIAQSQGADAVGRLQRAWTVLLPAFAQPDAVPYFREFLAREVQLAGPRD